ncbi:MAG TPA: alpha/beta-hydrolase family protein [Actinomycetota bacterium]|nr:alpha/beta-hydrolase family protein [Actinomycetota bacterium]
MTDVTDNLDLSAQAGILLGAFMTGRSFQPNLLSRATKDQAILSGVAAATGYGWGTSGHSLLRAVARRTGRGGLGTGAVIDVVTLTAAVALVRALPAHEHEPPRRALLRLAGIAKASDAAAGLVAAGARFIPGNPSVVMSGVALGIAGAGYATVHNATPGSLDATDGRAHEDVSRSISTPKAVVAGAVTTGLLIAAGHGEAKLSAGFARAAAAVLGGNAADHRTAGRLASFATIAAAGWGAVTLVNRKLAVGGSAPDNANLSAPELSEVTGGPGSLIPWEKQSREASRWLREVLRPGQITEIMQEPAKQPIRVYASLASAQTEAERADLLLAEIDRTGALDRSVFALFSPTGSGYVNYVATETLEYLTRGDCASACIQYSVLPSALSLNRVHMGTRQTRMVVNGIVERLLARAPEKRPKFVLFGESLGSQVSQEMFRGQGITGPAGISLDAAVWIGTPNATKWRAELWGDRTVSQVPPVGPGAVYLSRAVRDWRGLSPEQRAGVRYLLLQNGDDPIPKFGPEVVWRQPDWLGPQAGRPPGSPRGSQWQPVVTFFATFLDMQNALTPTPGQFDEGGHDYRRETPEAVRQVFGLQASDEQMKRVQKSLRERELRFEIQRDWDAAQSAPEDKRAEAEEKVEKRISDWIGHEVDAEEIKKLAE